MRTPSSRKCRLDLAPPLAAGSSGDGPHRLQPGTSPQALRIPPYDDTLPPEYGKQWLQVVLAYQLSLRARLDVSIPSAFSGPRAITPRFWIWRPSFERQRDFNPPEQRAAQRTLPYCDHTDTTC